MIRAESWSEDYAAPGPIAGRILDAILDADQDARTYPGYADPRDDDGRPVVSADWNRFPDRLVRVLERRYGWGIEWRDEVCDCTECGHAIQTEPDSWFWRPRFGVGEGEIICGRCLERSGLRWDDRERWPKILNPARLASVGVSADTLRRTLSNGSPSRFAMRGGASLRMRIGRRFGIGRTDRTIGRSIRGWTLQGPGRTATRTRTHGMRMRSSGCPIG
jgi:hypothetical protein